MKDKFTAQYEADRKEIKKLQDRADRVLQVSDDWKEDCERYRGRLLIGKHAHWCPDWDYLPIDETTSEWPCPCTFEIDKK